MSWNAHNFCGGLEGMIQSAFASAARSRSAAPTDQTGWHAINRLAGALRAERRRTTRLEAELLEAHRRLQTAEAALRHLRLR